jgi:hypothetical protein
MLGALPVVVAQVATRQQMLVDPNRPLELAAAAKQIAECEMQF